MKHRWLGPSSTSKTSHLPRWKFCPMKHWLPVPASPCHPILMSVSVGLMTLGTSYVEGPSSCLLVPGLFHSPQCPQSSQLLHSRSHFSRSPIGSPSTAVVKGTGEGAPPTHTGLLVVPGSGNSVPQEVDRQVNRLTVEKRPSWYPAPTGNSDL